jgi:hypothetical protein
VFEKLNGQAVAASILQKQMVQKENDSTELDCRQRPTIPDQPELILHSNNDSVTFERMNHEMKQFAEIWIGHKIRVWFVVMLKW